MDCRWPKTSGYSRLPGKVSKARRQHLDLFTSLQRALKSQGCGKSSYDYRHEQQMTYMCTCAFKHSFLHELALNSKFAIIYWVEKWVSSLLLSYFLWQRTYETEQVEYSVTTPHICVTVLIFSTGLKLTSAVFCSSRILEDFVLPSSLLFLWPRVSRRWRSKSIRLCSRVTCGYIFFNFLKNKKNKGPSPRIIGLKFIPLEQEIRTVPLLALLFFPRHYSFFPYRYIF